MHISKSQLENSLETPVLFLIFNRPELTKKVFAQIVKVKPKQLYIAADGPRVSHPDDELKCKETRKAVLDMIDWECEVNTLFRDKNLGCGLAVSQAITWFFEDVEMGIILEDDCYPSLGFFEFCRELLDFYKNDSDVMHVSGGSYIPLKYFKKNSYYFSKYPFVWGWATWKKAWDLFEFDISDLNSHIDETHPESSQRKYWHRIYEQIQSKEIDTWAWRWNFTLWKHKGIAINSTRNLIKNIGFQQEYTHTISPPWMYNRIRFYDDLESAIIHTSNKKIHEKADNMVFEYYNLRKIPVLQKLKEKLYGRLQSIFMGR